MRSVLRLPSIAFALAIAACGGGDHAVELTIDGGPSLSTSAASVILTGSSFVPPGSSCPTSSEYIIIGSLGPHDLGYANSATAINGPVFALSWVCNSEDGRVMHWQSNPILLVPGPNAITVTMRAPGRSSSDTTTVMRSGV